MGWFGLDPIYFLTKPEWFRPIFVGTGIWQEAGFQSIVYLAAIAGVIKHFRRIVSHWRSVLPDRLTEIRYEDLVADPVSGPRTLIAAAGLDWEDQCLDFHKSGGTVKTLSLHQVRQPIYQSSAQAWRRYETELQPFFDAWGDTEWD